MTTILDVDDATWDTEILGADGPVVVNFWGPRCPWCDRLDPVYEELAGEYGDRVKFAKVNVAENPDLTAHWGVMGTPTLKFFCQGRDVYEVVGFRPKERLEQELERALEEAQECLDQSSALA